MTIGMYHVNTVFGRMPDFSYLKDTVDMIHRSAAVSRGDMLQVSVILLVTVIVLIVVMGVLWPKK